MTSNLIDEKRLLSHTLFPETLEAVIQKTQDKIKQKGDKPYITVNQQLELLAQLSEFDFGRYLLQNRGINGYWTHYMLTHPWFGRKTGKNNRGESFSDLEDFILNQAPTMLATQQRFEIFLRENQKNVKNKAKLSSIPSGMMNELLYLNYENIQDIQLIGIDQDAETLNQANEIAQQKKLSKFVKLLERDAWQLEMQEEFDLISSNGLTIYEPDVAKITELYDQFYKALKFSGKLVTSFMTYPPTLTDHCEWEMSKIDQQAILLQKVIFLDIIDARFQCYQSSEQICSQLTSVGFKNIEILYDEAKIFPTVIAYK